MPGVASSGNALLATPFSAAEAAFLHAALLPWFSAHRRKLPWRGDAGPYAGVCDAALPAAPPRSAYGTWVSEVMLQQTRVSAVVPFWLKWMARFPTPAALAAAQADEVTAAWAGLGYYSRARNLQAGARTVVRDFGGQLPATAAALRALEGVGPYTAGAVASIAFGERAPAVDGNVVRVLARLRAAGLPARDPALVAACWAWAGELVPEGGGRAGAWCEALMELGATVCTPRAPACGGCPLRGACGSYAQARSAVGGGGGGGGGGAGASAGAAGDVEDAAGKWVAARFPAPPPKKAARKEAWRAFVVSWRPAAEEEPRFLALRSVSAAAAAPEAAAGGAGEEEEEEGEGGLAAEEGGGAAVKKGALLEGQWRPCLSYHVAAPTAEVPPPRAAGKRAREPAAAPPAVASSDAAALLAHAVDGGRLRGAPPARAALALGRLALRAASAPTAGKHVFSGVTHALTVQHWELLGGAAEAEALRDAAARRGGGAGARAEARWATVAELVEGGLTTWAAKVLFWGLAEEARAARSAAALGAGGGRGAAAWAALAERWRKAHCKL